MFVSNSAATHRVDSVEAQKHIEWGTERFAPGGYLTLKVGEDRLTLRVNLLDRKTLVIGRSAPNIKILPDIDLENYNAQAAGVSRMHAQLHIDEGKLFIEDLGSANGTYVNGTKLESGERRALLDGNEIMLARMKVQIYF
jgi:pSer/pThr/pTyr-binding forkhead associated (FHA) protein